MKRPPHYIGRIIFPAKGKGKGICLESRYPRYTCSSDFTFPLAVGAYGSLQLLIQPWICAPGTHYGWVDRGSVEYEVCPTLLHMASTGNRTPDLLILSPTPYPLGHVAAIHVCSVVFQCHQQNEISQFHIQHGTRYNWLITRKGKCCLNVTYLM